MKDQYSVAKRPFIKPFISAIERVLKCLYLSSRWAIFRTMLLIREMPWLINHFYLAVVANPSIAVISLFVSSFSIADYLLQSRSDNDLLTLMCLIKYYWHTLTASGLFCFRGYWFCVRRVCKWALAYVCTVCHSEWLPTCSWYGFRVPPQKSCWQVSFWTEAQRGASGRMMAAKGGPYSSQTEWWIWAFLKAQ